MNIGKVFDIEGAEKLVSGGAGFSPDNVEVNAVVPENVFVNYRFYYCILASVFLLPALGHFVTYLSMRKYPLTDEVMQEVSIKIAKERGLIEKTDEVTSE